ncbi:MAG: hypothetical protein V7784_14305 [Oceanospirillaceae bacterium]
MDGVYERPIILRKAQELSAMVGRPFALLTFILVAKRKSVDEVESL